MVNDIVKGTGGAVTVFEETLNAISGTILECKREEAKTERLEIQAQVYMCEKIEETKRELARLQNEDNRDRRLYEERMMELKNQAIKIFTDYNLQILSLAEKAEENYKKIKIYENQLEKISENEQKLLAIFDKDPYNEVVLEYLKSIMDSKQKIMTKLIENM